MYDIIAQIVDHVWNDQIYSTDQAYILAAALTLIIILTIWLLDRISCFIISVGKGGKK